MKAPVFEGFEVNGRFRRDLFKRLQTDIIAD